MKSDDELFGEALDLPLAERGAFLSKACGQDPAALARIQALLDAYDAAENFLERAPADRAETSPVEKVGDVIGPYVLKRKLGEGGWGVVYLAEQTHPVRRFVALKVIKLGMDTLNVIARFEAERQALAMMDHPDIARVFDAGATATGRPYFVMEFVDGAPITTFCDQQSLPMAGRLELFARVCLALQHAHQKGIIHRDIKPSNILVTLRDGVPLPKVIDFGIAKATQGRLTEHTLQTGFDQFIGTPAYMSPEQAELRDLDIDTRSDVYSLGVLLYELLTGRPPYDPKSLVRAGIAEIRRIIREVDPPRPSAAVSTLTNADRTTVAQLRRSAPTKLTSVLRGDLDWIVMRCLAKDRDRRYDTAHELADDVRRHLRREPVNARPPETWYRVQRFVARNRMACASAAAVLLAMIAGTVVSTLQAARATRAEHVARAERDVATAAGAAEALARADAQRRQEQAEDLLTFMLGDFRTELQKIGRLELLDAVGEKALDYFNALNVRDLSDTALTRQATALTQIGETRINQARYTEAEAAFTTAYDRAAALAARHPKNGDILFERAQAEYWIGFVGRSRGVATTEREWMTRYRDSTVELAKLENGSARAQSELTFGHHNLAVLDLESGRLEAARAGFRAEREAILSLHPDGQSPARYQSGLADCFSWLGSTDEFDGRYSDALANYTEMARLFTKLSERDDKAPRWKEKSGEGLAYCGRVLTLQGRWDEAAGRFRQASELLNFAVSTDPTNQRWRVAKLRVEMQQIALVLADGDPASAAPDLDRVRSELEDLVASEPTANRFTRDLATAWRLTASLRYATASTSVPSDTAQAAIDHAIELGETLNQASRADATSVSELARAYAWGARLAQVQGEPDRALDLASRGIALVADRITDSTDWRFLDSAAVAYRLLGDDTTATALRNRLTSAGFHSLDSLLPPIFDDTKSPPGTH